MSLIKAAHSLKHNISSLYSITLTFIPPTQTTLTFLPAVAHPIIHKGALPIRPVVHINPKACALQPSCLWQIYRKITD